MRGTETKRREDTARRAPPGRCFPFYRAFPPAPRGACPHAEGWGEALREQVDPAGRESSEVRADQTKRRVGRPGGTRRRRPRPAGGAVRGPRRLPLRTAQSCSRAMFSSGPALREGPRRRRRGGGGGAALTARRGGSPARPPSPATRMPLPAGQGSGPAARHARVPRRAPALPEPPDGRRLLLRGALSHRLPRSRGALARGTAPARAAPPAAAARAPPKWRARGAQAHLSRERERRVPAAPPARLCPPPAPHPRPRPRPRPRAPRTLPANRLARPRPRTPGGLRAGDRWAEAGRRGAGPGGPDPFGCERGSERPAHPPPL